MINKNSSLSAKIRINRKNRHSWANVFVFFVLMIFAQLVSAETGRRSSSESARGIPDPLVEQLKLIEGLRFEEISSTRPGYRLFQMWFRQPADHSNPEAESFEQSLVLWHLDTSRPMVLQTSGYAIFGFELSRLASEMQTNQIQVEHRYFQNSTPASKNYTLLTIEQSAADFHRITQAFKTIYPAKWAGTGRSKGGMTSVYHRRFYPDDVDATIAHVAPHSFSDNDQRYVDFVANEIGGKKYQLCRERLYESQKILLRNREKVRELPLAGTYQVVGSEDIAVEHAILGLSWAFWQYDLPTSSCSNIPSPESSLEAHIQFLADQNHPSDLSDSRLARYTPYFYQAATQLGAPGDSTKFFEGLLNFLDTFSMKTYLPKELRLEYDGGRAMQDVSQWLSTQSERIIFVYGETDPWTAGAFEPRSQGDSYKFVVPEMNHAAQFSQLQGASRELAYSKIREWLGVSLDATVLNSSYNTSVNKSVNASRFKSRSLEDLEFQIQKKQSSL